MNEIKGSPKSLKQLLQNTKYSIHYYQREYMWQRKHVEELLDDLTLEFLEYYNEDHERSEVQDYGVYFMGSVVLAGKENAIIDGQQRLSTLTLLLIYLNNRLKAVNKEHRKIREMIYSESYGKESFNIDVEDRVKCMYALFNNEPFDIENANESVKNLYGRYQDIEEIFSENRITEDMILHFCDWLIEKVLFIEIETETSQDAHKLFVTMNDRGLNLTSTEMLKGYLLSEIKDDEKRGDLNEIWKEKVLMLKKDDDKGDEVFIRAWLRAQYAESIREGNKGAVNKDFDIIGGPFHNWVRNQKHNLGLNNSEDFELFINKFARFAEIYTKIKEAENTLDEKTKYIYYNSKVDFTLQTQLLLAPICYEDSWETIFEKMNLVARFIDLYITSRVTNHSSVNYSTIKNAVFDYTKKIRHCEIDKLKERLNSLYLELNYNPENAIPEFRFNNSTRKYIKNMLARVTSFIEEETDEPSNYAKYMKWTRDPYEVEHIISNHYEWFSEEYNDQEDFYNYRNNIGALLLLRKSINTSLSDSSYDEKLKKYDSNDGNVYTASLHDGKYYNSPTFLRFIRENDLLFKPYDTFGKQEIKERNQLFVQLVKLVWNNDMFKN